MRFVMLYDGFQEFIPADIHTHITHTFIICATLPAEVATFAPQVKSRSNAIVIRECVMSFGKCYDLVTINKCTMSRAKRQHVTTL